MTKFTAIDTTNLLKASKEALQRSLNTKLPLVEQAASKVLLDKMIQRGDDQEPLPKPPLPPTIGELKVMIDALTERVAKLETKNGNGKTKI